jgi:hypothetical protein
MEFATAAKNQPLKIETMTMLFMQKQVMSLFAQR